MSPVTKMSEPSQPNASQQTESQLTLFAAGSPAKTEQFPVPPEYLEAVKAHNEALDAELAALAKYRITQSTEDGDALVAAHDRARELRKAKLAVEPDWLKVRS
jgi:hypothetical protein